MLVQWGESEEQDLFSLSFDNPRPSSWSKFPTDEKPDTRYKFSSIAFKQSPDLNIIERKTYSVLEWFRDVGGLSVALTKIGNLLLGSLSAFTLKATILTNVYRHMKSLTYAEPEVSDLESKEKLQRHMKWDFERGQRIQAPSYFTASFGCTRESKRWKHVLAKASKTVSKELNLVKFIKR